MRRLTPLLALAALVSPATASAAGLGEVAPTALAGTSTCLSATGVPGEVVHDAGTSEAVPARLDVLHAGPGGFAPVDTAQVGGEDFACASVAARPGGAAIAAGTDPNEEGGDRIRVTWAIVTADRRAVFFVYGVATRGGRPRALNASGGAARRRFALTLRHVRGVRFVELHAYASDGRGARPLVVRVR